MRCSEPGHCVPVAIYAFSRDGDWETFVSVVPVPPMSMKNVPRLATPWEFYWVLEQPGPLAGMAYPRSSPWQTLAGEGFRSVVCLTDSIIRYDPFPLKVLRAVKFKELYRGAYPDEAEAEQTALRDIVGAVRSELIQGKGVVVHCVAGTGRTGTVIACTLRALGLPLPDVLDYMEQLNTARGKPAGWPESEWQLQQVRKWPAF